MKKTFMSLFFLALIVIGSTGMVYAWFNTQGKVQGINISVANSGLLVNGQVEWETGLNFNNIYPGWTSSPISVAITNTSSSLPLEVKARMLFTGENYKALADTMKMAIVEQNTTPQASDFQTLTWWSETGKTLVSSLSGGQVKDYNLLFELPSTAGNEIQNIILTVNVLLTGTQAI